MKQYIDSLIIIISFFISTIIFMIDTRKKKSAKKRKILVEKTRKLRNKSIFNMYKTLLLKRCKEILDEPVDRYLQYLLYDENKEKSTIDKSIVDEIYNKKKQQIDWALLPAIIITHLYCAISVIYYPDIKIEILIILDVLIGLIIMSKLLLFYRIKKGYYGMNYEECKELIYYLMNDKDKNDINRGKKIFNEIEDYNKVGQEVTAVVGELQY